VRRELFPKMLASEAAKRRATEKRAVHFARYVIDAGSPVIGRDACKPLGMSATSVEQASVLARDEGWVELVKGVGFVAGEVRLPD
jgi:hypothetical protein